MSIAPKLVEVSNPTPGQRVKIRGHLDKSFDDAVGAYLDDMSDHKIAELVGVPRIIVERMREAAYGPIRVDPEMSAIRADIASLKTDIAKLRATADAMEKRAMDLGSRLEKHIAGKAP